MTTVGWLLNLDADLELADPDGFVPSARLVQQTEALAETFLAAARAASPQVEHVRLAAGVSVSFCESWCPTPRALRAVEERGGSLRGAPPLAVLQRANHRSFAAGLGVLLPGAAFATSMQQLDDLLGDVRPERSWLLKRPFGFSGRWQKRITGPLVGADRRWAEASMVEYGRGLMAEPFVAVEGEFALHAWRFEDGNVLVGDATRLVTDDLGAWVASETGAELSEAEHGALHAALASAARALAEAGYTGPFSIDAFRYRSDDGQVQFQALSELNARYSMGFFVGMGARVEEWAARVCRG